MWIFCIKPALMARGTQLTSTLTVASNNVIILSFVLPLPSSSACRMTDGDTNLPSIERKLGLQIWGIEVGQEGWHMSSVTVMAHVPLHIWVFMFQGRLILALICVGKEGPKDKIQWETEYFPMKCSTCYCFGFLLCETEMIMFTKETGMWWDCSNFSSTGGFSHPFLESMQGCFNTPEIPCFTKMSYP